MTKDKAKKIDKHQQLLEAARLGQLQQLESLLSQFHQLKSKKKTNPLASLRKSVGPNKIRDPVTGFTCLHHASLNGHASCVKLILNYGAKLNALDYKGSSALHLAAWAGNLEIVRILLNHIVASATTTTKPHRQPLNKQGSTSSSSTTNSTSSASNSPSNNSKSSDSPGNSTNLSTTQKSSSSKLQDMIDLCNNDNQTPLSLAAQFGHNQVVAELLALGANVHLRNSQLESPLDLACLNGRLETANLLLKSSASLVADLKKHKSTIFIDNSNLNNATSTLALMMNNNNLILSHSEDHSAQQPINSAARETNKKQTSGWSTLLGRGKRDSSGNTTSNATAALNSQQVSSPLHRFTRASLSMRQASKFFDFYSNQQQQQQQQQELASQSSSPSKEKRRATLSISAPLPPDFNAQQQQQHYYSKQVSIDNSGQWPPALTNTSLVNNNNSSESKLISVEKLLDHSPLHYAIRRGHLNVVQLLLYTYQANIMQLTTLGSVLHEIALSNGRQQISADMIALIFNYINTSLLLISSSNNNEIRNQKSFEVEVEKRRIEILDKFLSLKNSNQKNVFEVLNEINNRSAQEIKRLIYEYSEQTQQLVNNNAITTTTFNNCNKQQQNNHATSSNHDLSSQQSFIKTTANPQFSDIQQFNSFVTMKRVPKQFKAQLAAGHLDPSQHHATRAAFCMPPPLTTQLPCDTTQTIGRKGSRAAMMMQQQQINYPSAGNQHGWNQHHVMFGKNPINANSQLQLIGNNYIQQQKQVLPVMTRSVSNLNDFNSNFNSNLMLQQSFDERTRNYFPEQNQLQKGDLIWQHQWLKNDHGNALQLLDPSKDCAQVALLEKQFGQHSRSRDLGSLLQEAHQRHSVDLNNQFSEQNYNKTPSPFDNVPNTANSIQQQQFSHLVRSQTDCSQLMGSSRFFSAGADQINPTRQPPTPVERQQQQQHDGLNAAAKNSVDRKTINRHYHVYDHEFYPPRLIGNSQNNSSVNNIVHQNHQQQQLFLASSTVQHFLTEQMLADGGARRNLAIVPPLIVDNNNKLNSSNYSSSLRASARSTVNAATSCQQKQHSPLSSRTAKDIEQATSIDCPGGGGGHTSRLSLNIDQQQQQHNRSAIILQQQKDQMQQQMDRFLCRHSKRNQQPAELDNSNNQLCSQMKPNNNHNNLQEIEYNNQTQDQKNSLVVNCQPHQLHSSFSLESHLSEPHLFESTRLALMKDFDKLIGQELLNRNHQQIIGGTLFQSGTKGDNVINKSQQSILTGVQLDMDSHGDKLTVSGTRVTLPPSLVTKNQINTLCQQQPLNSATKNAKSSLGSSFDQQQQRDFISPMSVASHGTQTSKTDLSVSSSLELGDTCNYNLNARKPPIKPPRPSLANNNNNHNEKQQSEPMPVARQRTVEQKSFPSTAVIYDLPALSNNDSSSHDNNNDQSNNKPIAMGNQNKTKRTTSERIQKLTAQFSASISNSSISGGNVANSSNNATLLKTSLTEPPKVKPPPPPEVKASQTINSLENQQQSTSTLSYPFQVNSPTSTNRAHNSVDAQQPASLSSTGSNNDFGLLKMASITSTSSSNSSMNQQQHLSIRLSSTRQISDMDSGVCTSNSPASVSHDSETSGLCTSSSSSSTAAAAAVLVNDSMNSSTIINNNILSNKNLENNNSSNFSSEDDHGPPSPKTAQLCIEDAFMPLTMDKHVEMNNQMTSPMTTITNTTATTNTNNNIKSVKCSPTITPCVANLTIDRWLIENSPSGKSSRLSREERHKNHQDYDNCLELQKQLSHLNNVEVPTIIIKNSSFTNTVKATDNNDFDEDYAAASTEEEISSHSDDERSNSMKANVDENIDSLPKINKESVESEEEYQDYDNVVVVNSTTNNCSIYQKRKEVLLKVVVDEHEQNLTGNEVFYINPSELKKLGNANKRSQIDAETLTDEELCAAVDRDSGFIKFILRKRKNKDETKKPQHGGETTESAKQEEATKELIKGTKKTKLNPMITKSEKTSSNFEPSMNLMTTRRNSELTNSTTNRQKTTNQLQASLSQTRMNNILSMSNLDNQQQHLKELRNWFSINLAGLMDYLSKFVENGLDNIEFLNHFRILNDETLKFVGIEENTHRLLILETITNKLNSVELFLKNNSTIIAHSTIAELFNLLEMENLFIDNNSYGDVIKEVSRETISLIKERYSYLPIGYKNRLYVAIEFILDYILKEEEEQVETNSVVFEECVSKKDDKKMINRTINQASSLDSGAASCDIEMDISHASTSSSSKESIKSIVHLNKSTQQQLSADEESKSNISNEQKKDDTVLSLTKNIRCSLPLMVVDKNTGSNLEQQNETTNDCDKRNRRDMVKINIMKIDKTPKGACGASGRGGFFLKSGNSLVSETARKLEAAAAASTNNNAKNNKINHKQASQNQQAPSLPPRPVAALRRSNNNNKSSSIETTEQFNTTTERCPPPTLPPPPSTTTISNFNANKQPKLDSKQQGLSTSDSEKENLVNLPNSIVRLSQKPQPPAKPAKLAGYKKY